VSRSKVVLAPMKDNAFNRCKSEIRCVEAGAHGSVPVCSAVAPYVRFGAATIVKDRFKDWNAAVEMLLNDVSLWQQRSGQVMEKTKKDYSPDKINQNRLTWWKKILA